MSDWLLLLAAVGALYIALYGEILESPREWIKSLHPFFFALFSCSQCLGFWVGFSICLLNVLVFDLPAPRANIIYCFLFGCATSFVGSFFDYLIDLINAKTYNHENPRENNLPHNERDV